MLPADVPPVLARGRPVAADGCMTSHLAHNLGLPRLVNVNVSKGGEREEASPGASRPDLLRERVWLQL